jgi:hypothetical protein
MIGEEYQPPSETEKEFFVPYLEFSGRALGLPLTFYNVLDLLCHSVGSQLKSQIREF